MGLCSLSLSLSSLPVSPQVTSQVSHSRIKKALFKQAMKSKGKEVQRSVLFITMAT